MHTQLDLVQAVALPGRLLQWCRGGRHDKQDKTRHDNNRSDKSRLGQTRRDKTVAPEMNILRGTVRLLLLGLDTNSGLSSRGAAVATPRQRGSALRGIHAPREPSVHVFEHAYYYTE